MENKTNELFGLKSKKQIFKLVRKAKVELTSAVGVGGLPTILHNLIYGKPLWNIKYLALLHLEHHMFRKMSHAPYALRVVRTESENDYLLLF